MGRLGDWGDEEIWGLGDGETWRLGDLEMGRLGDWGDFSTSSGHHSKGGQSYCNSNRILSLLSNSVISLLESFPSKP